MLFINLQFGTDKLLDFPGRICCNGRMNGKKPAKAMAS
jgi:hypothetical protein